MLSNMKIKIKIKSFLLFMLPIIGTALQETGENLEFVKAVRGKGYPVEIHEVETEDGYFLTIFRIPCGKSTNQTNPYPVLLNHGLFGSAENFVFLGPEKSLGFVLSDNGYDVWLINCRGTDFSNKHRTLKATQKEYWEFTWNEIGVYDIPAVIDHVLKITNKSSIHYIGHSQGCTSLFVMGSERPEYNDKIKIVVALGPGAFYRHFKHQLLKVVASYEKSLQNLTELLNIYQMPPTFVSVGDIREFLKLVCVQTSVLKKSCAALFMLFTEANPATFDKNSLSQILPMAISSVSIKQLFHYAQAIHSGNFQHYDWGLEKNILKYGAIDPPLYSIKNITFPVALFYGNGDTLVTEQDVKLLASKLPNVVGLHKVPSENFRHVDFIFASNIDKVLNKQVLKIMKNYKIEKK